MKDLLYYKPRIVTEAKNQVHPGIKRFSHFFDIFNHDVIILDRTGTIKIPVRTHSLFPIPVYTLFTKTYEEVCNGRAEELLKKADEMQKRICVFYSGGIDSTTVLTSFLKNANESQKANITVLLSEHSIMENPEFYNNHIQGKLHTESSVNFMYVLGTDVIIVTGEHNDQLFGSDVVGKLMKVCGDDVIHKPYSRDLFMRFFNTIKNDPGMNTWYLDMFERLRLEAPIPIDTNYLFLWWINFTLKWQSVYLRPLVFAAERNIPFITAEYVSNRFFSFYNTDAFQLWSLNNPDKRIKADWKSYKWVAKDLIYDYTKDAEYRDTKTKVGSLYHLMVGNNSYRFIDTNFNFHKDVSFDEYYLPDNSFI